MAMKNSTDTIGNLTRDLLACIAVPQPTAPPRAPLVPTGVYEILQIIRYAVYKVGLRILTLNLPVEYVGFLSSF